MTVEGENLLTRGGGVLAPPAASPSRSPDSHSATSEPVAEVIVPRRVAARVVCYDPATNEVPLLFCPRHDFYKLPGGGVEIDDPSIEDAAVRECREEIGCDVVLDGGRAGRSYFGAFTESRVSGKSGKLRETVSHLFSGHIASRLPGGPAFTPSEIERGLRVVWCRDRDEALRIMREKNAAGEETTSAVEEIKPPTGGGGGSGDDIVAPVSSEGAENKKKHAAAVRDLHLFETVYKAWMCAGGATEPPIDRANDTSATLGGAIPLSQQPYSCAKEKPGRSSCCG